MDAVSQNSLVDVKIKFTLQFPTILLGMDWGEI